mmetsp:Transcript_87939/g.257095  ORF Transcript_87939/g.257095 Transcript_87939/m.257095 type:complete len:217 (+) Transcript_87939:104-754(+)
MQIPPRRLTPCVLFQRRWTLPARASDGNLPTCWLAACLGVPSLWLSPLKLLPLPLPSSPLHLRTAGTRSASWNSRTTGKVILPSSSSLNGRTVESSTWHVAWMRALLWFRCRSVTAAELTPSSMPSGTPSICWFTTLSTHWTSSKAESISAWRLVLPPCSPSSRCKAGEHSVTGTGSSMSSTCNHSGPLDGASSPGHGIESVAACSAELASTASTS